MHINTPQVAGGFSSVWWELPLLPLLVAAQLVHRAPQPLGPDELLIDELLHWLQMAHDGVPGMHPAWGYRRAGQHLLLSSLSLSVNCFFSKTHSSLRLLLTPLLLQEVIQAQTLSGFLCAHSTVTFSSFFWFEPWRSTGCRRPFMLLFECPALMGWGGGVTHVRLIYNPFSNSLKMPLPHPSMWDCLHWQHTARYSHAV